MARQAAWKVESKMEGGKQRRKEAWWIDKWVMIILLSILCQS